MQVRYCLRLTGRVQRNIERLVRFLALRDEAAANRAQEAIFAAFDVLEAFPFSCRKADPDNPFHRELLIEFGNTGYVALFEIEEERRVTVLAIRRQLEKDYE